MANCNLEMFRSFLTERFTAVALELFGEVENLVGAYREENKRLHNTLNAALKPQIKLHRIDQTCIASTTVVHKQSPEQRAGPGPESPEPWHPTIKVEPVEYETGMEEEKPQGLEGAGAMNFIITPICVKSDMEQDLNLGQTSNSVMEYKSEYTTINITEAMAVKTETETHGDLEETTAQSEMSTESEETVCGYEECGNSSEETGGNLGSTKSTANRPLQKTMVEMPRMTQQQPLTGELADYKSFSSRLTEAFKDIPDDKKPLITQMGLCNNVELVDCAFGKVPKGCPLSYQCPVPSSRDYSLHDDAPLPPSLPQPSLRLEPVVSIPRLSAKEQEYMNGLHTTWDAAHNLERSTRELSESVEDLRKSHLTSRFREICHLRPGKSNAMHVVCKLRKGTPKSKMTTLDEEQRPKALREYCKHVLVNWSPCGFVVHPDAPWLGAAPDGLVYDPAENPKYGLVHVKLPQTRSFVDCQFLNFQYGVLELKKNHPFYWQMQGDMMVTGTEWCDLVVYAEEDLLVQRVYRNEAMLKDMKEKLDSFFFSYYLPSLTSV